MLKLVVPFSLYKHSQAKGSESKILEGKKKETPLKNTLKLLKTAARLFTEQQDNSITHFALNDTVQIQSSILHFGVKFSFSRLYLFRCKNEPMTSASWSNPNVNHNVNLNHFSWLDYILFVPIIFYLHEHVSAKMQEYSRFRGSGPLCRRRNNSSAV